MKPTTMARHLDDAAHFARHAAAALERAQAQAVSRGEHDGTEHARTVALNLARWSARQARGLRINGRSST